MLRKISRNSEASFNDNLTPFLSEFVDDNWVVADLRKRTHKTGFAWGKFELNQYTRRHPIELVWIIQKKEGAAGPDGRELR